MGKDEIVILANRPKNGEKIILEILKKENQ